MATWQYCDVYLEISSSVNVSGYYSTSRTWRMAGLIRVKGATYPTQVAILAETEVTGFENDEIIPFSTDDNPRYFKNLLALLEAEAWELVEVDYETCLASMQRQVNST